MVKGNLGRKMFGLRVRIHYYRQSVQELKRHLEGGPEREAEEEWSLPPQGLFIQLSYTTQDT